MVDPALIIGGLGFATAVVSIIYSRSQLQAFREQAAAAQRQAEEATRLAALENSRSMYQTFTDIRGRRFRNATSLASILQHSPDVARLIDDIGGTEAFLLYRELVDAFQEVYLLRRRGAVEDAHWYVWTEANMAGPAMLPEFAKVFRYAGAQGFLHPDFVTWFEPLFKGGDVTDPLVRP